MASTIEIEHIQRWYEENPDKDENIENLSSDAKKSDEIITDSDLPFYEEEPPQIEETPKEHEVPKKTQKIVHRAKMRGYDIQWTDEHNIWINTDTSKMSVMYRYMKRAVKIARGYNESCDIADDYLPLTNVILTVHGIGAFGDPDKIVRNSKIFTQQMQKILKDENKVKKQPDGRIMILPIEWRNTLTLDGGRIEKATPDKIRYTREKLKENLNNLFNLIYHHQELNMGYFFKSFSSPSKLTGGMYQFSSTSCRMYHFLYPKLYKYLLALMCFISPFG